MEENGREESLPVRAEPLEWAQEISWTARSISTPTPSGPVNTVLVSKGVRVNELRQQTKATPLVA